MTGPPGGAACFGANAEICITCNANGTCPKGMIAAYVPNMPQSGNAAVVGCDMKLSGSPNQHKCEKCENGGTVAPFEGYFIRR